ncbi:MAG: dihydrofolate reductase [Bacteroidales bacterium]|nr:dihydrofolate reductase [Bacteroidales bacterium]
MKYVSKVTVLITISIMFACTGNNKEQEMKEDDFNYVLEQFADLRILRYQVPGFEDLSPDQKKLLYYLGQAALCGRDILWDQNGRYNLAVRQTLENIYETYSGDRETDEFKNFVTYLKRVWFSNGIYHHYSSDKITPEISEEYFRKLVEKSNANNLPQIEGMSKEESLEKIIKVIFDERYLPKKVSQDASKDLVANSAVNFYDEGITEKEVTSYYNSIRDIHDNTPVSYGLNTRITKNENGEIVEIPWKSGSIYGEAIDRIISWLNKAHEVAETEQQKEGIEKLIEYYKTGDLETWDEYNIIWVNDTSRVDFVNGFIEIYSDPLGMKASWESVVNFKDIEATKRTEIIAQNAQWFEDNSPVDNRFKKEEVKGVSAKVITVTMLGGDCYPHTPIGINLPNAGWIRKDHGSKSVTIENITYSYHQANLSSGFLEEFSFDSAQIELEKKYGYLTNNLHTDLHECLGHGSGKVLEGVTDDALKNYYSPLEETRADLFALYYIMDPKMIELGLLPNEEAPKAQYISYIRNGLMTQLKRIEPGNDIQQAHMRNRQLISKWCYEKGKKDDIIEKVNRDGKTYFVINDYNKLRELLGDLLAEVQRIKSEGDYEAGKVLVETYGVKVDPELHKEVLKRFEKLNLAAYSGFVNPDYELIEKNGEIIDIKVKYVDDYAKQMLNYSKNYSYLPVMN